MAHARALHHLAEERRPSGGPRARAHCVDLILVDQPGSTGPRHGVAHLVAHVFAALSEDIHRPSLDPDRLVAGWAIPGAGELPHVHASDPASAGTGQSLA